MPLIAAVDTSSPISSNSHHSSGEDDSLSARSGSSSSNKFALYIYPPASYTRDEVFQFHLTTRNFFAWLFGKPLVGNELGKALVGVQLRMDLYRTRGCDNAKDLLIYADYLGYSKVAQSCDYALGMLHFAESCQDKALWIDAFAHCVGLNSITPLKESSQFEGISKVSKALIARASLEMDLHLGRASRALNTFLEDELSVAHLGLSREARGYLDEFRSFLTSYAVAKYGYWPPPPDSIFPKFLYRSMQSDFQDLYDYLADNSASNEIQPDSPATGGMCVLQNITAFNQRQKYTPLPMALPLLPQISAASSPRGSTRALRALGISKEDRDGKHQQAMSYRWALHEAANRDDERLDKNQLVQKFVAFENEQVTRQNSSAAVIEARKVRWILVYGVLQMLVSVNRSPAEVKDKDSCTYPLCCLTAGTPPWIRSAKSVDLASKPVVIDSFRHLISPSVEGDYKHRFASQVTIRPDCETLGYFAYLQKPQSFPPLESTNTTSPPPIPRRKSLGRLRAASARLSRTSTPNLGHARFTSNPLPLSHAFNQDNFRIPEESTVFGVAKTLAKPASTLHLQTQVSSSGVDEMVSHHSASANSSIASEGWDFELQPSSPSARSVTDSITTPSLGDETSSSHTRSSLEYDSDTGRVDNNLQGEGIAQTDFFQNRSPGTSVRAGIQKSHQPQDSDIFDFKLDYASVESYLDKCMNGGDSYASIAV